MTDFVTVPTKIDESADFVVDEIKFGDGYSQSIPSGINNGLRMWNITWADVDSATKDAMITFFRTRQGATSFTWRPTGETVDIRVRCVSYTRPFENRYRGGLFAFTISAVFKEVP